MPLNCFSCKNLAIFKFYYNTTTSNNMQYALVDRLI